MRARNIIHQVSFSNGDRGFDFKNIKVRAKDQIDIFTFVFCFELDLSHFLLFSIETFVAVRAVRIQVGFKL